MKKLMVLFLIALLTSCEDPSFLPGKHEPSVLDSLIYEIVFEPNNMEIGMAHPYPQIDGSDILNFTFKVSNNTDTTITLKSIKLNSPEFFEITDFIQGSILAPKGKQGSSLTLNGIFSSSEASFYYDTVKINSISEPILPIKAVIPTIYPKDVDFGNISMNDANIPTKKLTIFNDSDLPINIDTVLFENENIYFSTNPDYPIEVPATSSTILLLNFNPINKGNIISSIILRYNSAVIADTMALIKAEVID